MNSTQSGDQDSAPPLATGRGIRIRDHRDRWVRMLPLRAATLPGLASRAIPGGVWDRIDVRTEWILQLSAAEKVGCAVVMALVFVVLVPTAASLLPRGGLGILLLVLLATLGLAMVLLRLANRWKQRQTAGSVVEAFLAERRCPACGYVLTGCVIADDSYTVCPECAAAWRMPETIATSLPPP